MDGYCKELGIAFEHQGQQHYRHIHFFHKNNHFDKIKENDNLKKKLCKKYKVKLIIIPELVTYTPIIDLPNLIRKECKKLKIRLPEKLKNNNFGLNYSKPNHVSENLKKIAAKKGHKIKTKFAISKHDKIEFVCKCGSSWSTTIHNYLNTEVGCKSCARTLSNQRRYENCNLTKEIKLLGKKRNHEVLNKKIRVFSEVISLKCLFCKKRWKMSGHTYKNAKNGCPQCRGKDLNSEAKSVAKKLGHIIIGKVGYYRENTLKIKCKCLNKWEVKAGLYINKKKDCPKCTRPKYNEKIVKELMIKGVKQGMTRRSQFIKMYGGAWGRALKMGYANKLANKYFKSTEDKIFEKMMNYASQNKGKILRKEKVGSRTYFFFKCLNKHIFKKRTDQIQSWCKYCKEIKK